ncbi:CRISPR-associated endonuclease Cas2 [Tundrisphaera sp. TA3]|uniref:CRISPR-associated endonuclease Cas2 n=1 Tax=Tundrisphaera sp. TA3 TaxID=3435775 RepID=UPI003EBB0B5A
MRVLVTYDIRTTTPGGQRRLRRVAQACEDYGRRVQYSVFELKVDPAQWETCRARLLEIIDLKTDNVRFYFLGTRWEHRVEHHGVDPGFDPDDPLIV